MYTRINNICYFFIGLSIVLSPLNGIGVGQLFGELSVEAYFYSISLGLIFFLLAIIKKGTIKIPKINAFYLMMTFFAIVIFSMILNIPSIADVVFKNRNGLSKASFQFVVIAFGVFCSIYIYNYIDIRNEMFYFLRRMIMVSFCVAGSYSIIEICALYGNGTATTILVFLESLFRMAQNSGTLSSGRLQSISGEPSWFGNYLAVAFPWIFSYILNSSKKWLYILINFYLCVLVILTASRTAYMIYGIQILSILFIFRKEIIYSNKKIALVCLCGLMIYGTIFVSLSVEKHNIDSKIDVIFSLTEVEGSNLSRYGSAITAFNIFLEHPFIGVGIGQYAFYMNDFVPIWALESYEIVGWADPNNPVWPPVHNIYARILCETGIIGFVGWTAFWVYLIYQLIIIKPIHQDDTIFMKILVVSLIGVLLTGFNVDTFRSFGYWLLAGVSFRTLTNTKV